MPGSTSAVTRTLGGIAVTSTTLGTALAGFIASSGGVSAPGAVSIGVR